MINVYFIDQQNENELLKRKPSTMTIDRVLAHNSYQLNSTL